MFQTQVMNFLATENTAISPKIHCKLSINSRIQRSSLMNRLSSRTQNFEETLIRSFWHRNGPEMLLWEYFMNFRILTEQWTVKPKLSKTIKSRNLPSGIGLQTEHESCEKCRDGLNCRISSQHELLNENGDFQKIHHTAVFPYKWPKKAWKYRKTK